MIIIGRLKWAEVANELHKMCLNEERKDIKWASEQALLEEELESCKYLLTELYQIIGQFQDEIPEAVLDKIIAQLYGDYKGIWIDEYPDLLPWVRGVS